MAERNRNGLMRPSHEGTDDSVSRHSYRRLTPAEVRIIEDRIAAQSREIQTLLQNNQGLAATHVALKQEVAAAQQELRRLSTTAASIKAERDAQVREVYERSLKVEAEARSVDGLSAELERVRAENKELRDERLGLTEKLKDIECDIASIQPELQEYSDIKAEIEVFQREIRRGRAAVDYERKMQSKNYEIGEAMEKHIISMAREAEKLRAELRNLNQWAATAVVGAVANNGSGYDIQEPGYAYAIQQSEYAYAIQQSEYANAIHQPEYANAIQQHGYSIQQPGYGENSVSDPHVAQPGYGRNMLFDPHVGQQPGYGRNTLSDPRVAQQPGYGENSLSDAQHVQPGHFGNMLSDPHGAQQPGCGENSLSEAHVVQNGENSSSDAHVVQNGEKSLSDAHAVQPGNGGNALSDPHVAQQPGYAENSVPDPHVVQPGYVGNTQSDPHVAHQGENSNQKEKADSKHLKRKRKSRGLNKKQKVETNLGGKVPMCADCQRNHTGECLKGTKVCFKCKEPGHMSYECTAFKEKGPNGKKVVVKEEAKHVIKGVPMCADCKRRHRGECLKGTKVCFKCRKPGHVSRQCTGFEEKKLDGKEKVGVIAQDGA